MAKEQLHNWGRYILLAIVIIFGTGGWAVMVGKNTNDIGDLQKDVKIVQKDIHKLELNNKDIANLAQKSVDQQSLLLEAIKEVAVSVRNVEETVANQAIIGAVNSEKLQSLTKE